MIEFTPIPVEFELERFGGASIDLHEWMRLRKYALEFVVGKGVNATSFTVLHTEAGFADLASHTQVKWLADHFELLCVAADEKHRHFLDIQYEGVIHRIPFDFCRTRSVRHCSASALRWIVLSELMKR